jgi:EmrB/QacA subfamily drug resistance transporter
LPRSFLSSPFVLVAEPHEAAAVKGDDKMQESHSRSEKNWVLAVASLASFMVALDTMVLTSALATIRANFDAPMEMLQWTVNAYNLSFAVLLLTGAALGDRFGRRRMFGLGVALFVLASIGCAVSTNIHGLIAARAAQGAAAALTLPLAMAQLSAAFPREERARALGIFSSVTGFALIAGPAMGGALTETFGWQWIFWINAPIGAVVLIMISMRLRESYGPTAGLDVRGLLLVAAASFALVWALLRGNRAGWSSAEVLTALCCGALLAAAFIIWELRARAPMVPLRLFRARAFSSGIVASFLFYAAMYGVLFLLPQLLQNALGNTPLGAGLRLLPWTATLFVTAPVAGGLVSKVGERALVVIGLSMQAIGLVWIALIATPALAYLALVPPLVLAGVGVSAAMPAVQNAILGSVAVVEMSKASGIFNMARFLGGVFGVALLVATFSANGAGPSPRDFIMDFTAGFAAAMFAAALLSLCGAIAGGWLPARERIVAAPTPKGA